MENLKIRYLVVAFLLLATACLVYGLQYDSSYDDEAGLVDLQAIPLQVGKWQGRDFPLDEMVYEILETRAIIHRSYTAGNKGSIFLSIVNYHDTKVDFHAPEGCLGGRGLKTTKKNKIITLFSGAQQKTINVAQIITTNPDNQTLTYYFFKAGKFVGSNYIKMRLAIAANKITNNDTEGSLIRISTTMLPNNKVKAELHLIDFFQEIYPYIEQYL